MFVENYTYNVYNPNIRSRIFFSIVNGSGTQTTARTLGIALINNIFSPTTHFSIFRDTMQVNISPYGQSGPRTTPSAGVLHPHNAHTLFILT
jgi:hypothetical protein